MTTLLLATSPPAELEEFFYFPGHGGEGMHGRLRATILKAAGVDLNGKSAEAALSEFQRKGIYLGFVNECPLASNLTLEPFAGVLIRRLRFSYKAKTVVLLGVGPSTLADRLRDEFVGTQIVALAEALPAESGSASDWDAFGAKLRDTFLYCP